MKFPETLSGRPDPEKINSEPASIVESREKEHVNEGEKNNKGLLSKLKNQAKLLILGARFKAMNPKVAKLVCVAGTLALGAMVGGMVIDGVIAGGTDMTDVDSVSGFGDIVEASSNEDYNTYLNRIDNGGSDADVSGITEEIGSSPQEIDPTPAETPTEPISKEIDLNSAEKPQGNYFYEKDSSLHEQGGFIGSNDLVAHANKLPPMPEMHSHGGGSSGDFGGVKLEGGQGSSDAVGSGAEQGDSGTSETPAEIKKDTGQSVEQKSGGDSEHDKTINIGGDSKHEGTAKLGGDSGLGGDAKHDVVTKLGGDAKHGKTIRI